jgi:NAD-dependent deacetylase
MIVMGSTLQVQPAASFPAMAKQNSAKLAIITLSETPLDPLADFVFHERIDDFVSSLKKLHPK